MFEENFLATSAIESSINFLSLAAGSHLRAHARVAKSVFKKRSDPRHQTPPEGSLHFFKICSLPLVRGACLQAKIYFEREELA